MMDGFLDSNFWSAIIGAVVGGLIALAAQAWVLWNDRQNKKADKLDRQKALGIAAISKLVRMHRQLHTFVEHFDEAAAALTPGQEPWTTAMPLAALPPVTEISVDELVNLYPMNQELFNDLTLYNDQYTVSVGTYETFMDRRERLLAMLQPDGMTGVTGHVYADAHLIASTAPLRAALNHMLPTMRLHFSANVTTGKSLIERTIASLNAALGTKLGATFDEVQASPASQTAP